VLPGLSRSGLTVAALLFRKFEDTEALRLSFLMSLPIVLGGNIILNATSFELSPVAVWGVVTSFLFGLLTIHLLFRLAKKVNFAWFAVLFGVATIAAAFI
jgi:undecaprenyl-diphosphatase